MAESSQSRGPFMKRIKRVLCPVDFSETSTKALEYAERVARSTGAELILLHVFDVPEDLGMLGQQVPSDATLPDKLQAIGPSSPDVPVERMLHAGPPAEVICWLAQDRHCDLIVMGTEGRTGLAHLFLGSVAEHVLRHARSPVVVVRNRPANEPPLEEPRVLPLRPPRFL
ncbi:MAG TPA: universal stress protein [Pirellulales bacterium]|nr:universal stress protein [Pirellulales bacterium]